MAVFEHYLYVLECGDGSLYTGYATDVESRVKAHQTGKGAKYTKSHQPVSLLAQARFYSKERAMSAEAYFKKLSRDDKDALLAKAAKEPFEDILRRELPGFGEDTASEFVARSLSQHIDEGYKDFQGKLMPTVDPKTMVGVRTPELRKIAKQLHKRADAADFMRALPHRYFDENQVHAFAIGSEKDYDTALAQIQAFLPYIDNWATCDQSPVKILAKNPERTLQMVDRWLASDAAYTIRYGIGVLMQLFLDDLFEPRFLDMVATTHMPSHGEEPASEYDVYYVNMMRAWYFAEAMAKQPEAALPYLERKGDDALLDEWTRKKAIQKSVESFRIPKETKDYLKSCR